MAKLTVHDIGRAGHPDATLTTTHSDKFVAYNVLVHRYGSANIRSRDTWAGTVGTMTGQVFQASKTWRIEP
jgi:hypothetical protein